jgi:hypothetical protein
MEAPRGTAEPAESKGPASPKPAEPKPAEPQDDRDDHESFYVDLTSAPVASFLVDMLAHPTAPP